MGEIKWWNLMDYNSIIQIKAAFCQLEMLKSHWLLYLYQFKKNWKPVYQETLISSNPKFNLFSCFKYCNSLRVRLITKRELLKMGKTRHSTKLTPEIKNWLKKKSY